MNEARTAEALTGIRVLNLSQNLGGAMIGQFFADFGADVVMVEPPGGSALRSQAGWPLWSRGSKSLVARLNDPAVRKLALGVDVLIDTFRPGVLERYRLDHDQLAAQNQRLVTTSITAFGRRGPLARFKGYEGIVMAKIGAYAQFSALVNQPRPAFATVPYCTASAAELAVAGTLVALYERESSGCGQRVETTLVQAIAAHDTWNWMISFWARKFPQAVTAAPAVDPGRRVPNNWLMYGLLQGLTKDRRWLQFSQASPKLFSAFLKVTGLDGAEWKDAWQAEDIDLRETFWERLLGAVRAKTVAEWQQTFDEHPDVFAEVFRSGTELLHHPQMLFDDDVAVSAVHGLGEVRAPKPFVRLEKTPGSALRPVPRLDEHGAVLRNSPSPATQEVANGAPARDLPLTGVTIVELGGFFAAPFGATVLADLGARVIKVEPPEGDFIRFQVPFPEIGGVKVTQGKQSVAVDIGRPEGVAIVKRLLARADVVLQSFRAGVAQRLGLDEATIRAVNPSVIYHEAPGFGTAGPYGHRPAYAPTIGAGSGMARRNVKSAVPERTDLTLEQVKDGALKMGAASMTVGHADGFSALGVACAEALGLLVRKRGHGGQRVVTTMLLTLAHVLSEDMIEYPGRPEAPAADADLLGLGPLYWLYETARGWVFLAAPQECEWEALRKAMPASAGLDDHRFATAQGRDRFADDLAARLTQAFRARTADEWEAMLTEADLGCTAVDPGPSHNTLMMPGGLAQQLDMTTEVEHPMFGRHPRLKAVISFSRSATRAGPGILIGQHTDLVLNELGYSEQELEDLAARGVIRRGQVPDKGASGDQIKGEKGR
jgi:crotonobetainyl-CoA:carnitine CoA-transferase CaiB-like acyl-CoA transferase